MRLHHGDIQRNVQKHFKFVQICTDPSKFVQIYALEDSIQWNSTHNCHMRAIIRLVMRLCGTYLEQICVTLGESLVRSSLSFFKRTDRLYGIGKKNQANYYDHKLNSNILYFVPISLNILFSYTHVHTHTLHADQGWIPTHFQLVEVFLDNL